MSDWISYPVGGNRSFRPTGSEHVTRPSLLVTIEATTFVVSRPICGWSDPGSRQRKPGQLDDFATLQSRLMGADADAGPVG